jgi:hypothetical protein
MLNILIQQVYIQKQDVEPTTNITRVLTAPEFI